ncbi:superinfection immunity protein [Novosphingobium sp.]|uniref:superinfection immunity protein n=1 Tax=Novosphingobium sp. TaxID=1874826 RepID=UPI002B48AC99|nr:superinfection immunity protein [Novosphingobium sp.]HKR93218.1 superinfection immunity protein [Novosphingobium sp.]
MGGLSIWHWLIVLVILPISFLPTIVAFARRIARRWWVLLLNLFAGWTGIGWIAAMIWAAVGRPADVVSSSSETFQ